MYYLAILPNEDGMTPFHDIYYKITRFSTAKMFPIVHKVTFVLTYHRAPKDFPWFELKTLAAESHLELNWNVYLMRLSLFVSRRPNY